ncbi:MAG: hypothetical protein ACOYUZ_05465 [Patescibacteria group bacterium]
MVRWCQWITPPQQGGEERKMKRALCATVISSLFVLACSGSEDIQLPSGNAGFDHDAAFGPEPDAGQEAAAGSAGEAGSGGSSGSAGEAGNGGTGGSGGSAGEAGSAGSSGSAGQAGSGGSAGQAGSSGSGGSAGAPPVYTECDTHGQLGKVVIYMKAPMLADHVLSLGGWIDFPNWVGDDDTHGTALWCWGEPAKNELVCLPKLDDGTEADIYDGTVLTVWPGLSPYSSSDPEQEQSSWYCEEDGCPVGTYVFCKNKLEIAALRDGELSGAAEYADPPWVNIRVHVP